MGNRANDVAPGVVERGCVLGKTDTQIHPCLKRIPLVMLRMGGKLELPFFTILRAQFNYLAMARSQDE